MFCPKCGKGEQEPNAYCRSCGEFLQDLSKPIMLAWGGTTPAQNVSTTLFFNILSAIFAMVVVIALASDFHGRSDAPTAVYLAISFSLCIAGWQISSFFVSLKLQRQFRRRQIATQKFNEFNKMPATRNNVLLAADTANIARPPNVTENTTSLLEPIPNRSTNKFNS